MSEQHADTFARMLMVKFLERRHTKDGALESANRMLRLFNGRAHVSDLDAVTKRLATHFEDWPIYHDYVARLRPSKELCNKDAEP
jgi:hypothetical protein